MRATGTPPAREPQLQCHNSCSSALSSKAVPGSCRCLALSLISSACRLESTQTIEPPHVLQVEAGRGIYVGAAVTLSRVASTFRELAAALPAHQASALRAVVEQLRWFAGPPIR